jgi:hypothetical protein
VLCCAVQLWVGTGTWTHCKPGLTCTAIVTIQAGRGQGAPDPALYDGHVHAVFGPMLGGMPMLRLTHSRGVPKGFGGAQVAVHQASLVVTKTLIFADARPHPAMQVPQVGRQEPSRPQQLLPWPPAWALPGLMQRHWQQLAS